MSVLAGEVAAAARMNPIEVSGTVSAVRGLSVEVQDLPLPVGARVSVGAGGMVAGGMVAERREGQVVGFAGGKTTVMMLDVGVGVRPGERVSGRCEQPTALVGPGLIGRVVDGLGRPIDGKGAVREVVRGPLSPAPMNPLDRPAIEKRLVTGVKVVDLMTPVGRGQRLGIFAGPGVGKSTLMGQMARHTEADVSVIGLIGERGREVAEFIHDVLGEEGLARSVVVVATGDESPLMRIRAASLAMSAAEHFRDRGRQVLLLMDSVTRFAHAQRQVGLAAGEPPATKGYTPSVFGEMARLLERAGTARTAFGEGAITGFFTILVDGDDMTEPVADAARGILDGHLVLSRKIAERGQYPAVDPLASISRVGDRVVSVEHAAARRQVVKMLARYREIEDLVQIGAYAEGANPESDVSREMIGPISALLSQGTKERVTIEAVTKELIGLALKSGESVADRMRAGARAARR